MKQHKVCLTVCLWQRLIEKLRINFLVAKKYFMVRMVTKADFDAQVKGSDYLRDQIKPLEGK